MYVVGFHPEAKMWSATVYSLMSIILLHHYAEIKADIFKGMQIFFNHVWEYITTVLKNKFIV